MFSSGVAISLKSPPIPEFVFFATLFVYSAQRFYKLMKGHIHSETPRILWMKKHLGLIKIFILIAFFGSMFYGYGVVFHKSWKPFWESSLALRGIILLFCALISAFYVVRLGARNLREIPFLKIFFVVIVYFLICCVLPITDLKAVEYLLIRTNYQVVCYLFALFLYVFAIALLFDVSDINVDPPSQKTIPQTIGAKWSEYLSIALMLPFLFVLMAFYRPFWMKILVVIIHLLFIVGFVSYRKKALFINFFGEAMLGIVGLILYYLYS